METILITGGAGFLGPQLATKLSESPKYRIVLSDVIPPTVPAGAAHPENISCVAADLCNPEDLSCLLAACAPLRAVYALHGIMSAGSEADPALSRRVNLEATVALIEGVSQARPGTRVVVASSIAVYGGAPYDYPVSEATWPTPRGTYGTHKLMVELLVSEMNRRGEIDGFALRIPTVSVRPGRPSAAASSFFSGLVREPLRGERCVVPLKDRDFEAWLCGPRTLIKNLVRFMELPGDVLPAYARSLLLPGISVSIQEMRDALAKVGGLERLDLVSEEEDPVLAPLVRSWPGKVDCSVAMAMGLHRDESFEQLVREYVDSSS